MAQRIQRVAVIGSGAAGLATAHRLQPSFTVDVFEASNVVGGTWHYTEECDIHGSMYRDLHTNLPKDIMAFPDFPWCVPSDRSFVHHTNVQEYLVQYSKQLEVEPLIRFNHRVTQLAKVATKDNDDSHRDPYSQWQLTALDTTTNVELAQTYDAIVVCNGHYAKPYIPAIANIDRFKGQVLHSHNYRIPEPFANKTVVVLGGGQSGRDIAQELCSTAQKVVLAHRAAPIRMPPLEETTPVVDVNDQGHLVTCDQEVVEADVLIYATGYHFDFPFLNLAQSGLSMQPPKRIQGLYRHLLAIHEPSLAFIGIPIKVHT
jgi:cation diffusion facilitator CzcD-associated flavoprotein CzcO